MKQETYKQGQYSQFKLENGKRYFLEALPRVLTIKKMVLIVPTKTVWSYTLPFYIRTATESWDTSIELLEIVINALNEVRNQEEFGTVLNPKIESYVNQNKQKAEMIAIQKVGHHARWHREQGHHEHGLERSGQRAPLYSFRF